MAWREERELSIGSKLRRTSQSSVDSCCPHWTGVCVCVCVCACVRVCVCVGRGVFVCVCDDTSSDFRGMVSIATP